MWSELVCLKNCLRSGESVTRVIVLGMDSLDSRLVNRFQDSLPNFRRLLGRTPRMQMRSVFPPDSATAWASIYTGLNPARHGVIYFIDPLERVSQTAYTDIGNEWMRGKTFWDIAGKAGKRVCILFPHLGYPVWQVNGVMVGRSSSTNTKKHPPLTCPESLSLQHDLEKFSLVKGLPPPGSLGKYVDLNFELVRRETEFGISMLSNQRWDLFFLYSSAMDWVQHNLWCYFDRNDPGYPGPNKYEKRIPDLYRLYDKMLGCFLSSVDEDTTLIVMSDHGHGMRPPILVNLNKILLENDLLALRGEERRRIRGHRLTEAAKTGASELIARFSLGAIAARMMQCVPFLRDIYTRPSAIDFEKTIAHVSDLSGIKAYNYGGIVIKKDTLSEEEYNEIRNRIVSELEALKDEKGKESVTRWVRKRESLYAGRHLQKYPDVVFNLKQKYGVGWSMNESLFSKASTHSVMPGSHEGDTPVFIISGADREVAFTKGMTLMDVFPTILGLLGIDDFPEVDGRSILRS